MKNFITFLSLTVVITALNAQDLNFNKFGIGGNSKVNEVGLDHIKFKKYNNSKGLIYALNIKDVYKISYKNDNIESVNYEDTKNEQEVIEPTKDSRKGLYLGFNVSPGFGKYLYEDSNLGFSFNMGLNFDIYFNNIIGIKTGLSYMNLSSPTTLWLTDANGTAIGIYNLTGSISLIGIPIKLLLTTGRNVGFYFETGINFYFPFYSNFGVKPGQSIAGNSTGYFLDYNSFVLAYESTMGVNVNISSKMSLNAGLLVNYSITKYFQDFDESKALILGLNFGMLFKLGK